MSTIRLMQLRAEENLALNDALQALVKIANVRAFQRNESEREAELFRKDTLDAEARAEKVGDMIREAAENRSLHANTYEQSAKNLFAYMRRLEHERDEHAALIQLCMTANRTSSSVLDSRVEEIMAEVDRLKAKAEAKELPF